MFKLEIETDGAAFRDDNGEALDPKARELRVLLGKVEIQLAHGFTDGVLMDGNGNKVGHWSCNDWRKAARESEFGYLTAYITESCFDDEICRDRLRMLWTAYCLHHNLNVDTSGYDNDLMDLWNKLAETGDGTSGWEDFDGFENFMCAYLV